MMKESVCTRPRSRKFVFGWDSYRENARNKIFGIFVLFCPPWSVELNLSFKLEILKFECERYRSTIYNLQSIYVLSWGPIAGVTEAGWCYCQVVVNTLDSSLSVLPRVGCPQPCWRCCTDSIAKGSQEPKKRTLSVRHDQLLPVVMYTILHPSRCARRLRLLLMFSR